jgi:hypothetical protein
MFDIPITRPELPSIEILRCPAGGKFDCLILGEPMCTYTHFYRGRTYPCPSGDCPLCKADCRARFYSYTPVGFRGSLRLLELTQSATWQLAEQVKGDYFGKVTEIWRQGKRQNSPLKAKVTHDRAEETKDPELPDVRRILLKIWTMPFDNGEATDDEIAEHVRTRLKALMNE